MERVIKVDGAHGRAVVRAATDTLEEFPPREAPRLDFPPISDPARPEFTDSEAIRRAVLAEAREEAAQKIQEAYAEAFERGVEAGREHFAQSVAQASAALQSAAEAMQRAREEFLASLAPQVIELTALIVRRILGRESREDPELIHRTVRRTLEKIADRQRLVVQAHPADLEALRAQKIRLLEDFPGVDILEVQASDSVSPGGCIVESERMHVDARLETLLGNILRALEGSDSCPPST